MAQDAAIQQCGRTCWMYRAVVYSHLCKVYNELYGKGGLKQNVQAMRVMPTMPMNVAYGAMDTGEVLSSAPSVPALEHMAFGAMTHTEFKLRNLRTGSAATR